MAATLPKDAEGRLPDDGLRRPLPQRLGQTPSARRLAAVVRDEPGVQRRLVDHHGDIAGAVPGRAGDADHALAAAEQAGISIEGFEILHTEHSHAAAALAVELAVAGKVGSVMKGSLHSDELLGAVVGSAIVARSGGAYTRFRVLGSITYIIVAVVCGKLLPNRGTLTALDLQPIFIIGPIIYIAIGLLSTRIPDPKKGTIVHDLVTSDDAAEKTSKVQNSQPMPKLIPPFLLAFAFYQGALYGVSANSRAKWGGDQAARAHIGFTPRDNAEDWAAELEGKTAPAGSPAARFHGGSVCEIGFQGDPDRIV